MTPEKTLTVDEERFIFRWADLPLLSEGLLGTGGVLRTEPEDFQVEELPLYLPSGEGSHAYAWVEKRGLTTRDLVVALRGAGVEERSVGVAGLKDKHALTRQWLSVPNRHAEALETLDALEGVRILARSRHKNKLGIGHLSGNRFTIRVREAEEGALGRAEETLERLKKRGVPNLFGPQRFGRFGTNAVDGLKLVRGEWVPGGHRLKRFFLSALQSHLFNYGLKRRLERGLFERVVPGDWAKKHDTGGTFLVEDADRESERAKRFEISATLPLYGKKVRVSPDEAGVLEEEVLAHFGLRWLDFTKRRGSRRLTRVGLGEVGLTPNKGGYTLSFTLPKGSFATIVLREVMKTEVDASEGDEHDED